MTSIQQTAVAITTATSADQAHAALTGLRRADLIALAAQMGIAHRSGATTTELRQAIVHHGYQRQANSRAIAG